MLIWGARSYGLALSSLRNYYFNRDSMINVLGYSTELVVRLCFGGGINTFETDNDCALTGQGKVFAEGVKRDMDELKGCFRKDTPRYNSVMARDLKEPKSAHEQLRRPIALLLQDVEYEATSAAEKAISELGLVTGFRIYDALFVEKHGQSEDLVKTILARAANEAVNLLFPQQGAILFEPTPLSLSSKPLVATTSLSDFVYRETGFILNELEDLPDSVQNGYDVAFYMGFCDTVPAQLIKDSKKQDPDGGLWQLVDTKDPPPALPMAVRQFALDQEARDPELSLKWGKALCGSHSWQAYHSAMRIYVRNLGEEMWHGNNPSNSDLALFNKVYDWQNHTVRSYNKDDYYASSLTIDYQAWDEQDPDECDEELRKQYEGFFEDEVAKDRVCGRLAVHVLMRNGNFRKKVLVFKGNGGNGKSGLVSSLKHTFRMIDALGRESPVRWISEATAENLWNNKSEINVSLAEAYPSKIVLLEEGIKIKSEPFKRFTGGPGSAGGASVPYQGTTQSTTNFCTPIFNINNEITFETPNNLPPDDATIARLDIMQFKVTNYSSALTLETKIAALALDAKQSFEAAGAHSKNELRKWEAAAASGVYLSPAELEAVAHHKLHLTQNPFFDEAAARKQLGSFHRLGDPQYAFNQQHNGRALASFFMDLAKHARKYHHGGEDSLVPLEADSVAEAMSLAPPESTADKLAVFFKTEIVFDATKCITTADMVRAASAYLIHGGQSIDMANLQVVKALAKLTKSVFDTSFNCMPVLRGMRSKIRPAYEKCTLTNPLWKNRIAYCRVALAPGSEPETVEDDAAFMAAAMQEFDMLVQPLPTVQAMTAACSPVVTFEAHPFDMEATQRQHYLFNVSNFLSSRYKAESGAET
ncbi:hypothetical protein T492DRAFT_869930 [Pavlovales sp. CCMP2436]|nr:hypothetical protein T492DRAFT_869930 [Pavlovales sp. CCMP2436]